MTDEAPTHDAPMTPERWRAVDAILQAALACEPARRDAVVAAACGDDRALRDEVASLLAAHVEAEGDGFLERPAMPPVEERLARALAGRYAIAREIARGGMATVHLARDLRHDRWVAIKVMREELAAAVGAERFLAEIRVTAALQHPHVLPLFDSGEADGLLWYAMPYVEGETLRARLARAGPLPVAEAVRIAREIADALDHAHARGIVHRDVKPENVLLRDGHALVADFGIALALEHAGGERLTRTGIAIGTPQYMAPEQAAGERAVDARADVYALGAVLHEMLAGESPFAAPTRQAVVHRLMHEPPAALAARRPDVAPWIDAAVRRALAKRPEARFASAAAFAAALAVPLDETDPGGYAPRPEPRPAPRGRTVSARAALYAALGMLAAGLAGGLLLVRSPLVRRVADAVPAVEAPADARAWTQPRQQRQGRTATGGDAQLTVFDRTGRALQTIPATRPWTPRLSPDGRRVAYGAFGEGRGSSDLWVTELADGTTRRLTDDDRDSNDPQWSADGATLVFSASASGGKDLVAASRTGDDARVLARRDGTQFPSDWLRDGRALLVTEEARENGHDILVQPTDGSPARPYVATPANELAARVSPDGRWVAYTSDASGRPEVYLDAYPRPGRPLRLSTEGGEHPVWRGDGRELYYWRDGALMALPMKRAAGGALPVPGTPTVLFRTSYQGGVSTMYDASADGQRFVIVRGP